MEIAIALGIITGLTQVIKILGTPTKYIPLVAVLLGVIYAVVTVGFDGDNIFAGIILGLTTVGLYRTGQKLTE